MNLASVFRSAWAAALALALAAAAGPARAQPVRAEPVAEGVYAVFGESALGSRANRNHISNAGFVVTDAGVVVIDALGSPVLAEELVAEIRRITPLPIRAVVVTHYHADHIYGLQVFRRLGATLIAHAGAREYLQSDTARQRLAYSREEMAPWIDEHTELQAADRWLGADGRPVDEVLRVGSTELRIRHAGPAHTPEDLVVHVPSRGVLFAGDLVFRGRVPFVGQADSRRWITALEALLAMQPRLVVPGHGPVSDTPMADLTLTRDYLVYLRRTMGEAARAMEPFDEAYDRVDWSRYAALPLFRAANRMNAYNTYLLMEREGDAPR